MVDITLSDLTKSFDTANVFDGLDLAIEDHSYVCLLGPSGCGKTTLMRIISGLDRADCGVIRFNGQDVAALTSAERDVGMAFQNYALYPHLTVEGNLRFPLQAPMQKGRWTDEGMRVRIAEIAELLQITPLLHRTIDQLSGGQQQRVSLGRALIRHPKILLLDEPVTHLDARLRYAMRSELKRIHSVMKTTTIHVTHDQQEALAMADLLVIMRNGRIEQASPAMETYSNPATSFVAGFLGDPPRSLLEVELGESDGAAIARLDGAALPLPDRLRAAASGARDRRVILALPARAFTLADESETGIAMEGTVRAHEMLEGAQRIVLDVAGQKINLQDSAARHVVIGDRLKLLADASEGMLFDRGTDLRLRTS
ncbi:MAG: ABC transporter ATP-binding protein [Geminicoccaceae bacterium]